MIHPVLDIGGDLLHRGACGSHPRPLCHWVAVAHGIGVAVDDPDGEGIPGLRVVLKELPPGLDGVLVGGAALGIDGCVDQVCVPCFPGLLIALLELVRRELGMCRDLGLLRQRLIELLRGEILPIPQFPLPHGDGEGHDPDPQLFPQGLGDIGGGIGQKQDLRHSGLLP